MVNNILIFWRATGWQINAEFCLKVGWKQNNGSPDLVWFTTQVYCQLFYSEKFLEHTACKQIGLELYCVAKSKSTNRMP